jgi:hypothetical protein
MKNLDPKQSLNELISRRLAFERARGDRTTEAHALQVAINRAETECGNLMHHIENNYVLRHLHGQLLGELEMGKGVLRQAATATR